jgi:hypothetical protein
MYPAHPYHFLPFGASTMKVLPSALLTALLIPVLVSPAFAGVNLGDTAPDFTKNELDYPTIGQVTSRSLADYSGKVLVFFLFGCG